MRKTINVGFIGNPNCGKTTLFNAFTGANLKVANWPGVTVACYIQGAGIQAHRSSGHIQPYILYDGRDRIKGVHYER